MLIKIFDGYVNNPGDISWEPVERCGKTILYDRCSRDEFLERLPGTEIAVASKQLWDEEAFSVGKDLKMIALTSTGFNVVDLEQATARGVVVANVPAYSTPDVAQHTIALILELCNHVGAHSEEVMKGAWTRCPDFCYWDHPLIEFADKTLGIIGLGSIGRAVAKIAQAFGAEVIFYNRTPRPAYETEHCHQVSLDELFAQADFISLHCADTKDTEHIINADAIAKMKDGVSIINAARGGLVDESALRAALDAGKVAGAAVDVVAHEPMRPDCPLLGAPNMIITPHIAWATVEARTRLITQLGANIAAFIAGDPVNVVNPAVLAH